jgi:iron complex outermembrane recepter protein
MPTGRVTWTPTPHHTLWAAISSADRTPSSQDTAIRVNSPGLPAPGGMPTLISLFGNPNLNDEGLIAYEAGYRTAVSSFLSLDFAAYYNDYRSQQTTEPLTPFLESTPFPAHLVIPFTYENLGYGETHGFEIAANWKVANRWTLSPSYDFERIYMHVRPSSQDAEASPGTEGSDPHVHGRLRSHVDLLQALTWDVSAVFADRLQFLRVPAYTRLDTGLSWQVRERLSLALIGQNLARDRHLEFTDSAAGTGATLMKRSGYVKVTWQF